MEGELEQRAAVVHVRNRMGALEVGLAVQVQHAEESTATVGQGEARMVSAMEQENCVVELQQVEERLREVQGKCEGLETVDCQSLWRVQMEGSIAKLNADA